MADRIEFSQAVEAAKRRQLARDLFPEPAARYRVYMPERYDADGRLIGKWTKADDEVFDYRVEADKSSLANYAESILSAPPPAPTVDAATAEKCRAFVRKCRLVIEGWGGHPHAEDDLAAELLAMFAGGAGDGPTLRNPIISAGVRDAGDEWHVECRFADGQKYAAITVSKSNDGEDTDEERLVDWIAKNIPTEPAK